jgi:hypothetical protein
MKPETGRHSGGATQSVARDYSAEEVRRLLAVVPDTVRRIRPAPDYSPLQPPPTSTASPSIRTWHRFSESGSMNTSRAGAIARLAWDRGRAALLRGRRRRTRRDA